MPGKNRKCLVYNLQELYQLYSGYFGVNFGGIIKCLATKLLLLWSFRILELHHQVTRLSQGSDVTLPVNKSNILKEIRVTNSTL